MVVIHNITILFLSIFLESFPFILLGSVLSALMEQYISNETIAKMIPKNKVLASITGIVLGFFIPACDCAVIPISKRLIKKGVPVNVAISFMLASPIINPVVLLSTYYAFSTIDMSLFWLRFFFGIGIAFVVGLLVGFFFKKSVLKSSKEEECNHEEGHCCHQDQHFNYPVEVMDETMMHDFKTLSNHDFKIFYGISKADCSLHYSNTKRCFKNDLFAILKHCAYDFLDIIKYLIVGALLAASIQVLLPQTVLQLFEHNNLLSILALMLFAYFLSLCSTSDSFIGKSLLATFSKNAVLGYLLLGPMIDIKNTIVLFGNYKKSFTVTLIVLLFIMTLISCALVVIP